MSHHLKVLRDEGVVAVEPDANERLYRLHWQTLERIDRVLIDLYEKWDQRTGWPYRTDPLRAVPRRHRLAERTGHRPIVQHEVEPLAPPDESWFEDEEE